MKNKWSTTRYLVALGFLTVLVLITMFLYELSGIKQQQEVLAINVAKAHAATVISIREWGAKQEGVYVTLEHIAPNPYLKDPLRDLIALEGPELTKLNPAYLTRLLGELTAKNNGVIFHLTSLLPINPDNNPDAWEKDALLSFDQGETSKWVIGDFNGEKQVRYMEPLFVEPNCLKCHWEQGYLPGQIKGGISVRFSYEPFGIAQKKQIKVMGTRFLAFGLILIVFTAGFAGKSYLNEQEKLGYSKKIEYLSQMDELMGIFNRRALLQRLDEEIEIAVRHGRPLAIILFDLDDFKLVNDQYGHLAGDWVLKSSAQLIKDNIRSIDSVGRYGGDELMVILPGLAKEKAEIVMERIVSAMDNKVFQYEEHQIRQQASCGLAELAADTKKENGKILRDLLIQAADNQLYIEKRLSEQANK
ncbi:MAG: diguanylate cyclase [Bacillota bacterium]